MSKCWVSLRMSRDLTVGAFRRTESWDANVYRSTSAGPYQQGIPFSATGQRLTASPCMFVHLERISRDLVQGPGVAVLAYAAKLRLDRVHLRFHVDDSFGGVEEAAVARPARL